MKGEYVITLGGHRIKTPAICGCVIGEDTSIMEIAVDRAIEQGADLIELRLDGLRNWSGWQRLLHTDVPLIVANHPKHEGGYFRCNERTRIKPLLYSITSGVACVDIELSTQQQQLSKVIKAAKRRRTSLLISHHNFYKTPPANELVNLVKLMVEAGCDLAKVVTFAKTSYDVLVILDFLAEISRSVDIPVIAFAMGKAGKLSRIAAPFFGSPIVYAAANRPTALGQFDVATMKRFLRELNLR